MLVLDAVRDPILSAPFHSLGILFPFRGLFCFFSFFSPRLLEQRRLAPLLRVRRFGFLRVSVLFDAELRFGFLLGFCSLCNVWGQCAERGWGMSVVAPVVSLIPE